jgi:hypothetical protein
MRKIRRRRDDAKEDMSRRMLEKKEKGELETRNIHCTKRLSTFPSPSGMSLTKLSLDSPARESLVSDIPAGVGKFDNLCHSVREAKEK